MASVNSQISGHTIKSVGYVSHCRSVIEHSLNETLRLGCFALLSTPTSDSRKR